MLSQTNKNLITADSKILIMTFLMIQIERILFNGTKEEDKKKEAMNQVLVLSLLVPSLYLKKMNRSLNQWISMTTTNCIPKST